MKRQAAEMAFLLLEQAVEPMDREECAMIIDVFLEDTFTDDECKRLLCYLLKYVTQAKRQDLIERIEAKIGTLPLQDEQA